MVSAAVLTLLVIPAGYLLGKRHLLARAIGAMPARPAAG